MKRLTTVYEWVLFLPAVLPLFYMQGMMYPLLAPKTLALRALGIIALALFSALALSGKEFYWDRLRAKGAWIPVALLALAYIASWFGYDFYHSFWSTFERGDGLLTLSVCVEFFYLFLLSAEKTWLPRLFKIVAWTGVLAAVYLILQWIGVVAGVNLPFIVQPNGRVGGTMGNAAFLAAYLGMAFFATLAAARDYAGGWRKTLYAGAFLELFAILLTATRGTQLALFIIGVVALIYLAVKREGKARRRARIALGTLLILAGLFVALRAQLAQVPFAPIQRIASVSTSDATVASRLFLWQNISREALPHALLGYGAENINIPFNAVYDPSKIVEEWFDRSHNAYLDYFVQFGIGGLLLYLALIALVLRAGWRLWKKGSPYGLPVFWLTSVYALQNFFVFDTSMTLWLLLAAAGLALAVESADALEAPTTLARTYPVLGTLAGIALLFLSIPVVIQPLRANLLAFESYQYQIVDVARAHSAAEQGIALNTYADLEFGYNAYFMYTENQITRLAGDDLKAAHDNAVWLLSRNFERYPYDARTAVYLAQVLVSVPLEGMTIDRTFLSTVLERAIRLSPKRVQPWYILANLSISDGNKYPVGSKERAAGYAAARDILSRYITLVPHLSEPYFVLAQLDFAAGNKAEAAAEAAKGKEYYSSNLETAMRAAAYYENALNLPDAAFFLAEIVRLDPSNTAAAEDLAAIRSHGYGQ